MPDFVEIGPSVTEIAIFQFLILADAAILSV